MDKGDLLGSAAGSTDGPARRQTGCLRALAVLGKPAAKWGEQKHKTGSEKVIPEMEGKEAGAGKDFEPNTMQHRLILHKDLLKE
jgi:hypothetical protein